MGGCLVKSRCHDWSLSSIFGNCKTEDCGATCSQEQKEDIRQNVVHVEEVVDAFLKKWIEDHLHGTLQRHIPAALAAHIESTMIAAINVDLIPRHSSAPPSMGSSPIPTPATTFRYLDHPSLFNRGIASPTGDTAFDHASLRSPASV